MFQKLAPLLILVMFATGAYLMIQGMQSAIDMGKGKKEVEIKKELEVKK